MWAACLEQANREATLRHSKHHPIVTTDRFEQFKPCILDSYISMLGTESGPQFIAKHYEILHYAKISDRQGPNPNRR